MSATAGEIRTALAAALRAGLTGVQVSPYMLSQPTLPSAHVMRGEVEYDQAMQGGTHTWQFRVQVLVAMLNDIAASTSLDAYLAADGDRSVKAALEADVTLGGIVQTLHVMSATGEQVFVREQGGQVLGSEWAVAVWL